MVPSLGQNRARYSRLSDVMLRIIPEATPDIREAAYLNVREHAGTWTYYLTYSIGDTNDPDYRVAYATASTMEGDGSQWTYRGEILVCLINLGAEAFHVRRGDRIAQGIIAAAPQWTLVEADELDDTVRGAGGHGSTGV